MVRLGNKGDLQPGANGVLDQTETASGHGYGCLGQHKERDALGCHGQRRNGLGGNASGSRRFLRCRLGQPEEIAMALGDQAGLAAVQAAVAQIPGLEAFLGDRITDLHATLTDSLATAANSATALETKTLADLAAIVAPGIAQLTRACDLLERIQKGGMVVTVSFPS